MVVYILEMKMRFELEVLGFGSCQCKKALQRNPASRVARPHLG